VVGGTRPVMALLGRCPSEMWVMEKLLPKDTRRSAAGWGLSNTCRVLSPLAWIVLLDSELRG